MEYFKSKTVDDLVKLHNDAFNRSSPATQTTFKQSMRRIEKLFNMPLQSKGINTVLENPDVFMELLDKSSYSENTKMVTITNILKVLKIIDAPLILYNQWLTILKEKTAERTERENLALKQKLSVLMDYKDIRDLVDDKANEYMTSTSKSLEDYKNYMILALFSLQIPVRVSNYVNMRVVDDKDMMDDKCNYLLLEGDDYKMVFNKYRTHHILGQKTIKIGNPTLQFLIDKWLAEYNKSSTNFLIQSENNKRPMNGRQIQEAFTNGAKATLGISLSIDNLRASYMKHIVKLNPDFEDQLDIANIMGYSTTDVMDKHQ